MIVECSKVKGRKSLYKCDRCKAEVLTDSTVGLYTKNPANQKNITKKWDLCLSCYRKLCKSIERGVVKNEKI